MKILALCGSLRPQSRSLALLRAARSLAPAEMDFQIFDRHGELPLFNPNVESDPPEPVRALRVAVTTADAVVIASPEYAHGVTGNIKNTLDWLVGHVHFVNKPVAVLNPAYQSHHADDSLREILRTMSAELIVEACVRVPVIGSGVDLDDIATTSVFSSVLESALHSIVEHVRRTTTTRELCSVLE